MPSPDFDPIRFYRATYAATLDVAFVNQPYRTFYQGLRDGLVDRMALYTRLREVDQGVGLAFFAFLRLRWAARDNWVSPAEELMQMVERGEADRAPILADCLEENGFADAAILAALRGT